MKIEDSVGIEAGHWLLRLQEDESRSDDAFLDWVTRSPHHVRVFLETFETYRVLGNMDPARLMNIEALLNSLDADVIRLRRPASPAIEPASRHPRALLAALAAVVATVVVATGLYFQTLRSQTYATAVGEQRTRKLEDGSFLHLNTDSQVKVQFSDRERRIELERGEVLFVVERDSARPFRVITQDAHIQALGTQFNVRRRIGLTEVAVVEGTVQVTPIASASAEATARPAAARLTAGEEVRVDRRRVEKKADANISTVMSWRSRRLAFTEASLEEVAAEFNRYNDRKIRVEGSMASRKRLTGIFDADRPAALILYTMKDGSLVVEPQGDEWIIRGK